MQIKKDWCNNQTDTIAHDIYKLVISLPHVCRDHLGNQDTVVEHLGPSVSETFYWLFLNPSKGQAWQELSYKPMIKVGMCVGTQLYV